MYTGNISVCSWKILVCTTGSLLYTHVYEEMPPLHTHKIMPTYINRCVLFVKNLK